jgi:hypothetical protein
VERTNLNGYEVGEDVSDDHRICFVVQEYASGENAHQLDGLLVRIIDVFLPKSENMTTRALFHCNCHYGYVDIVGTNYN